MRTIFTSRVAAVMSLLIFSLLFVCATFSYGAEPGEETVCLRKPNAEELAIVIRHDKGYYDENKEWIKTIDSATIDINGDNRQDIVFTDLGRTGSCGHSWDVLLNMGNGQYKMIRIFDCTGACITFLKEMKNGFRMARTDGGVLFYDAKKCGYVDRKGRR